MRHLTFSTCCLVAFASVAPLACSDSRSAPNPASPSLPGPLPLTGYTLSGVVFEHSERGDVPLSEGKVRYYAAPTETPANGIHGSVRLDANGRYVIPDLPRGHRVKLGAYVPVGLGQPCAAHVTMDTDGVLDVALVRPGTRLTTPASPTLAGIVTVMTAEGPRPAVGEPVAFYGDDFPGMVDVLTWTDGAGRYEFCGLPPGAGHVGAGDCHDAMHFVNVTIPRDTQVDIDLTSMVRSCPS